jgi:hypothetical protein
MIRILEQRGLLYQERNHDMESLIPAVKTGKKTFRLCVRYQVIRPCVRFDAGWVGLQPLIIGNVKGASKRAL